MKTFDAVFCKKLYLEYVNNYLTISKLCEDYNLELEDCIYMLNFGKSQNELSKNPLTTKVIL